ncbi:HD domain-containing protein [Rhizobium sp. ARZ01]|uniref:HD domain-containing protein n=1 Tax=Rhizobium sp. ARZ01 TaxID=2769313 RepID=UPI00178492A8|nr:HD domain-containing protein [Rhizobium sp. ARZ01]MBD9371798.1 HD domain-containing protein [Rhizobium sp. ARZ01]
MNHFEQLNRAIEIAQTAHQTQLDKVGEPYFEHCRRVAEQVTSADEKTVAFLHDVVEKTRSWSLERLEAEGFSRPVLEAVRALTRAPPESDDSFVRRAMGDSLARGVKIADLNDNLVQILQVDGDVERLTHELAIAKAELKAVA